MLHYNSVYVLELFDSGMKSASITKIILVEGFKFVLMSIKLPNNFCKVG